MDGYDLLPVELGPEQLNPVATLLQTAFPDALHFTQRVLQWQYTENPAGFAVGTNAWSAGELAGHYVALPMRARVHGIPERGLLSLNTATHSAHQGKGLFTRLAMATFERAANEGYGFVVGVANANSTPGFLKKLGFSLVSPLKAMIGGGPVPARTGTGPVHFEQAWEADTLAWRLHHPAFTYSAKHVRRGTLILSNRTQFGARYILSMRNMAEIPAGLPTETRAVWRKVWIGLDPALQWRGHAYINIPMRLRPAPLNLIFKDLTGANRSLDPATVRFDCMDFDIL
ncbi:MAG: GNAT family N-acetyltransferase [Flavobacteriales bacterium]|nr:GNAT family N-acetyltransferase [Flavobacteriales bacterium]